MTAASPPTPAFLALPDLASRALAGAVVLRLRGLHRGRARR